MISEYFNSFKIREYFSVIDNGPARKEQHAQKLQLMGEEISDPYEVSILRREDLNFVKGKSVGDDVLQCNNKPSSATPRGHQSKLHIETDAHEMIIFQFMFLSLILFFSSFGFSLDGYWVG